MKGMVIQVIRHACFSARWSGQWQAGGDDFLTHSSSSPILACPPVERGQLQELARVAQTDDSGRSL
jgi:hypothetical protein